VICNNAFMSIVTLKLLAEAVIRRILCKCEGTGSPWVSATAQFIHCTW
jgi:hypothetical protein